MWQLPFKDKQWTITNNSDSFKTVDQTTTIEVPISPHCGSYGYVRKNHTHEGIDFYTHTGTPVYAVEDGIVVKIEYFTGPSSTPTSPWWNETMGVHITGETGVVVYGEISLCVELGQEIKAGQQIGNVLQVLKKDKGRPMSMLHLELYEHGMDITHPWEPNGVKPKGLLDPTKYILEALRM